MKSINGIYFIVYDKSILVPRASLSSHMPALSEGKSGLGSRMLSHVYSWVFYKKI